MRILVVGAGGVGSAVAAIARRRDFFETLVLADLDRARARPRCLDARP
jgi:saccharopine dehydrogenase-like NADP-dependent oxidoreductase